MQRVWISVHAVSAALILACDAPDASREQPLVAFDEAFTILDSTTLRAPSEPIGDLTALVPLTDRYIVLDQYLANLRVFATDGSLLRESGRHGDAPGEFRGPRLLAVAPEGEIVVYDRRLHRLSAFDSTLRLLDVRTPQMSSVESIVALEGRRMALLGAWHDTLVQRGEHGSTHVGAVFDRDDAITALLPELAPPKNPYEDAVRHVVAARCGDSLVWALYTDNVVYSSDSGGALLTVAHPVYHRPEWPAPHSFDPPRPSRDWGNWLNSHVWLSRLIQIGPRHVAVQFRRAGDGEDPEYWYSVVTCSGAHLLDTGPTPMRIHGTASAGLIASRRNQEGDVVIYRLTHIAFTE